MMGANQGIELTQPDAYRQRILALLGDRNPLDVMAQTAATLADIVRSNSTETLRARPFAGKWTPNEVIGHLADTEWTYGFRLRMILCQERPTILGMDQDLWVAGQKHNERAPAELVEIFAALRGFNLVYWRRLAPADLERCGVHNERGPESLDLMRRMCAGHDLSHIDQINRYLAAIKK